MEQEHRISYKAGITRTPSDFLCGDGELAECINLTSDSEELKPVVQPAEFINDWATGARGRAEIVYVHKVANRDNYIGYFPSDSNKLCCGAVSNKVFSVNTTFNSFYWQPGTSKITSIGNTLIISDSDGLNYLKWDGNLGTYKMLSNIFPEIQFDAYLRPLWVTTPARSSVVSSTGNCDGIFNNEDVEDQESYNDLVTGLYAKNLKQVAQNKGFSEPFLMRLALKMYDGSYTLITNPILFFPTVNMSSYASWGIQRINTLTLYTYHNALLFKQSTDYSEYSDIIKNIVIFVSEGINIYDVSTDQPFSKYNPGDNVMNSVCWWLTQGENYSKYRTMQAPSNYATFSALKKRDDSEIINDIKSTSLFYKICEIGIKPTDGYVNIAEKIETHTLEFLNTQPKIEFDDYFSRCNLSPSLIYSYNSRLNIANVSRGFFDGFSFFLPWDNDTSSSYDFYVTIKTEYGENVVVKRHIDNCYTKQGYYFFYPDSRASNVVIMQGNTKILDAKLTEHQGLNGAYYLAGLPSDNGPSRENNQGGSTTVSNKPKEQLPNYIITSEVNNPWVFKAEGYNKVGTGKIIGISETTMALSQDAYGRNDLVVFSESGTWGMAVDRTGLFQSIHPFTRDVCINVNSITKADFGIFFVTKKGLMLMTDQGVNCVSERMNGKTFNTSSLSPLATDTDWASIVSTCQGNTSFLDYIRDLRCFLAYDYIDSRVLIINHAYGYQYIFNMKDDTLSKTILPQVAHAKVESYPDNLLLGTSNVYSFYEKPREEEVSGRQTAFLLTRPMKLAGPVSQASLRQLKNVGMWAGSSVVKTELYLSEDMQTWYNDISRHGAAARYYRIALYIKMLPTERLSGTILTAQERRNNNIR